MSSYIFFIITPFLSPIKTSSLSTYAKATFLENALHFRVKNPVGQENQFLRSGFFIRWKCGAILLKGSFFPRRTIVWNYFWKSILISVITFNFHGITANEKMGSIYESLVKKHFNIHKVAKSNFTNFQFSIQKFKILSS